MTWDQATTPVVAESGGSFPERNPLSPAYLLPVPDQALDGINSGGGSRCQPQEPAPVEVCKCDHPMGKHIHVNLGGDGREFGSCSLCPCRLFRRAAI